MRASEIAVRFDLFEKLILLAILIYCGIVLWPAKKSETHSYIPAVVVFGNSDSECRQAAFLDRDKNQIILSEQVRCGQ